MPTRAPTRHQTRLCAYFYSYGKQCGTRTFPFLVLSLCFIAYYSYSLIFHSVNSISTTLNHVDARFWEFSPYLQPENATLSSIPGLIIQQVRITNDKRIVDSRLLNHARDIERALTSHSVTVDGKLSSLASICKLHYGQCMIHSPAHYWNDKEQEMMDSSMMDMINTRAGSVSETTGLSMHPLSVFGNVTLDNHGRFRSADSIMITVFLQQQQPYMTYSKRVWDALWQSVSTQLHIEPLRVDGDHHQEIDAEAWQTQFHMHPQLLNYKFKILVFDHAYLYLAAFILVCFIASGLFAGYAHHVRSQFAHGFAVMFTVVASYTTTIGILDSFDIKLSVAPWYLLLVVPAMASIENMLLLTEAVLSAGCDMQIKEKIGRGLESVGLPMTLTLLAEQTILAIGSAMDVPLINEFCLFARVALLVGYALDMTFTLAFLAINVKCVELTDLDDHQTSKRLRELAKFGMDEDQAEDFCPVQEPADDNVPKSCAECKQFKTHRTYNALMLCLIILSLTLLRPSIQYTTPIADMNMELRSVSHRFWNMVNPFHRRMALQVNPPQLVIYSPTAMDAYLHAHRIEEHYRTKNSLDNLHPIQPAAVVAPTTQHRQPSRFRKAVFTGIQQAIEFLMQINLPSVLLTLVLVGIIMWLNPSSHERWLQPMWRFLVDDVVDMTRTKIIRIVSWSDNYDKDGVHRGAISAQKQFNQQQLEHNIKDVTIKTLSGRHIADIRRLAINAKYGTVVSCGQDGRIIMWDADHAEWMARLDRMRKTHGEIMEADLNPKYWRMGDNRRMVRKNHAATTITTDDLQSTLLQSARCIKLDQGNKWIAAGFDDGIIRVWKITTGTLLRELRVETRMPVTIEEQQDSPTMTLRHRKTPNNDETSIKNTRRTVMDRVVAVQFIGAVTEYCHPLVAEVAAKQRVKNAYDDSSQNFLVSVHKSGMMREWDILSGECIQSFPSGHQRDVTVLHVVECKPPHRKLGITWVFTASKDGLIKCWERRLAKQQPNNAMDEPLDQGMSSSSNSSSTTTWTCVYTIEEHYGHAITSLATEIPVGGMGVLVSGSSDGAVKVWDFESGDAVCTLSAGGVQRKKPEIHAGGPLLKFSKFNHAEDVYYGSDNLYRLDEHDNDKSPDHHGPITQVVVTRYCQVENGPGICRGCDTCFGNGFGIASCAMDETVHVWRLERADGKHEGSCTLCSKDYHQKRRKPRQEDTTTTTMINNDFKSARRRGGSTTTTTGRRVYGPPMNGASVNQHEKLGAGIDGLVDIEQLGGETNIALTPKFLGKIDQLAGRGLVFCNNMVLAGVRKKRRGDWEAWFASLKYYDEGCQDDITIPVEAFDLDTTHKQPTLSTQKSPSSAGIIRDSGLWNDVKRWLFGDEAAVKRQQQQPWEPEDDSDDDENYDEANELLPFSTVRHTVPLDGSGIACDYGNFIKLVYLDDQCRKRSQLADEASISYTSKKGCKCGDKCAGSSACCGGSNCSSGGDKKQCCGGTSKRAVRRQRNQRTTTVTKNICNVSECSITNCSRASDCPAAGTSSSSSSKTRNLYRWS